MTLALFYLLTGLSWQAVAAPKASVKLPDHVSVQGPRILLGQVARIDASDPGLASELSSVLIGFAPLPGESRSMARGELQQALALAGYIPGEVELLGATRVSVKRVAQVIAEQQLSRAVREVLARELGFRQDELALRSVRVANRVLVGGGTIELRAEILGAARLEAPVHARVVVFVGGVPAAQVGVEVEAIHRAQARAFVDERPQLRRASSRRREAWMVRRGQQVTLELQGAGLHITTVGRARSSGGLGDEIPVENIISGTVIRGVVNGTGRVRVYWSPSAGLGGAKQP